MNVFLILAFVIAGIFLSFLPAAGKLIFKQGIHSFALGLAIAITLLNAVLFFAGIENQEIKDFLSFGYLWGKLSWFLITAFLTTVLVRKVGVKTAIPVATVASYTPVSRYTLAGAIVMGAGFFLLVSIGKLRHATEMDAFFIQSGYPAFFNIVIIVIECVCSAGLLLHFKFRTGPLAATILLLDMCAAIGTHARNGDPLPDSYDAFMQLIILIFLVILFALERKIRRQSMIRTADPLV